MKLQGAWSLQFFMLLDAQIQKICEKKIYIYSLINMSMLYVKLQALFICIKHYVS